MATFTIRNLTFSYPERTDAALKNVSIQVESGDFVTVCGQSGSGKSTLLKNLKPILAPYGSRTGNILFGGIPLEGLSQKEQAARIGFVMQNPDNQIVTDKVWHELAFGLESLGVEMKSIRLRVAEMASFFGIQTWFHKDVNELSGGQKQLLNLAAVMVMQPDVLILDEPTSQLDPIAAGDFLETVKKINRELGTTVIISEHRLEEVIPLSNKVAVLDKGELISYDTPANTGAILAERNHPMFMAMPSPLQAYSIVYQEGIGREHKCPVDVRGGRNWLTQLFEDIEPVISRLPEENREAPYAPPVVEARDVWFRYNRQDEDVVKDLSMEVYQGEFFGLLGGNGTGKTTTLNLLSGIREPYRGSIKIKGKALGKYKKKDLFKGLIGVLPQNPQSIFVEKTVELDLLEMFEGMNISVEEKHRRINEIAELVEIEDFMNMHPYDLSGGEQQRAALAKVLLLEPEILLLDEPTKGLDSSFKSRLAELLSNLKRKGITIIMVSHDVEFCGRYADRCAMFFDGKIITTNTPRAFFSGNSFYTTVANRMSRHIFDNAVTVEDVVELVIANWDGDTVNPHPVKVGADEGDSNKGGSGEAGPGKADSSEGRPCEDKSAAGDEGYPSEKDSEYELPSTDSTEAAVKKHRKWVLEISMGILALITILVGGAVFDNKQYFAISFLLIIYAMVPFFARFERRKPKARELVILAVMVAVAVIGRAAFFMIPNFKPILAIVIISGVALGRESGFMVGAMSAFVSNFLFGQGPWTPWQMLAMAVIGYLAGLLFHKHTDRIRILPLMIYGGLAVFLIYGAIVDFWTIIAITDKPTLETALMVYGSAVYFNLIHAIATVIFIGLLAKPILGKLNRVKVKYGM